MFVRTRPCLRTILRLLAISRKHPACAVPGLSKVRVCVQYLWCRGPKSAEARIPPPSNLSILRFFGQMRMTGLLKFGLLFLAGSGGKYSACPPLRRCGFGVPAVDFNSAVPKLAFGIAGTLPGMVQHSGRAEVYALCAVTDNENTFVTFCKFEAIGFTFDGTYKGDSDDLWRAFCLLMERRPGSLTMRWVKAHISPEGGDASTTFAGAAQEHPYLLVAVLQALPRRQRAKKAVGALPSFTSCAQLSPVSVLPLQVSTATSAHCIFARGAALACELCGSFCLIAQKARVKKWLAAPCDKNAFEGHVERSQAIIPTPLRALAAVSAVVVGHRELHKSHHL